MASLGIPNTTQLASSCATGLLHFQQPAGPGESARYLQTASGMNAPGNRGNRRYGLNAAPISGILVLADSNFVVLFNQVLGSRRNGGSSFLAGLS